MMRFPHWTQFTAALALLGLAISGLSQTSSAQDAPKPVRALLVIGGGFHDYPKQKEILTKGISARANVQWTIAYDPDTNTKHLHSIYESTDWAKGYDVVVHDECSADVKDLALINRILEPHRQGLPGVVLHCSMHSFRSEGWPKKTTPWFEFTGLATTAHGPLAPIALNFLDKDSPITKGQTEWTTVNEELYNNYIGKLEGSAQPLVRGKQTVKMKNGESRIDDTVVAWINMYRGKTKVFGTTLGHTNTTVGDPRYLDLVARGLLWSAGKLDPAHLQPAKQVLLDSPK